TSTANNPNTPRQKSPTPEPKKSTLASVVTWVERTRCWGWEKSTAFNPNTPRQESRTPERTKSTLASAMTWVERTRYAALVTCDESKAATLRLCHIIHGQESCLCSLAVLRTPRVVSKQLNDVSPP
ncbi:hypothetical protein FRC00_008427, partial [Tulasnella sp. 408]